jgi:hypothetical protein
MTKKVNEQVMKYEIHIYLAIIVGCTAMATNLLNQF